MADELDVAPVKGPAVKDLRADWIRGRVCSSLKVRDELVQKLLQGDAKTIVASFLDDPDTRRLLVFYDGKELLASNKPLGKYKRKAIYFIKPHPVKLDNENINKEVLHGELNEVPLETLSAVAQSVFLPLLSSANNQEGWPDVVAREVTENLHKFVAHVKVSIGESKGQTLLPLPAAEPPSLAAAAAAATAAAAAASAAPSSPAGEAVLAPRPGHLPLADAEKVHILESSVVTWTRQIKKVLQADPDAPLKVRGAHPGPLVELDFWRERAENLESIHEQLTGERIQKVVKVLELARSTYHPAFERLFKEVEAALEEATNNVRFLAPLRRLLEKLSTMDDFVALVDLFKPIMHTLLLIWKHSKHYNSAARMATLLQEICNDLISQAQRFVPGQELLRMDPSEACDKLRLALRVLGLFKSRYFAYRAASAAECPERPWRFQNSVIFGRLDRHMARCAEMLSLAGTVLQFSRLERVEVGGTRGKTITAAIKAVHADFNTAYEKFQQVPYDVMDVDAPQYGEDHGVLKAAVSELEHRLGALIIQAFDDCTTLSSSFKLLDSFEGLLERETIAAELAKKQAELVKSFAADVTEVAELFEAGRDAPILARNAPPHAGAVAWVRGLRARLSEPHAKLVAKDHGALLETREGKAAAAAYERAVSAMDAYESDTVQAWRDQVDVTSEGKLNLPLLQFHADATPELPLLAVNFDPALVALLRETKYFLLLQTPVPGAATAVFQRADTYRTQIGSLDLMVTLYNRIQRTILAVEKPLVDGKLSAVEAALKQGLEELRWRSDGIDAFIKDALELVRDLDAVLATLKDNVRRTQEVLRAFERNLMFERKEGKVYTAEELADASSALLATRHSEMRDAGKEIGKLLSASNRVVKASKTTPAWRAYVEYMSEVVIHGFAAAIMASATYLLAQMDPEQIARSNCGPLLEIQLELIAPDVVWSPELGGSGSGTAPGVRDLVTRWLAGFMEVGSLVKRLDVGEGTYAVELEEDYHVYDVLGQVMDITLANEAKCEEFREQFLRFDFLWKTDTAATLKAFLEANAVQLPDGGRDDPPLSKFEEQIQRYKAVGAEVAALPSSATIGWLRVSAKPLKQALATWASKWVYLFTKYLQDKVTGSVSELYTFMDGADATLARKVLGEGGEEGAEAEAESAVSPAAAEQAAAAEEEEAHRKALYDIMSCMRDVRKRSERTDGMFEPLRETVASLQGAGVALPDGVLRQLENAEVRWKGLKKQILNRREALAALQQAEAVDIRRKSDAFNERVEEYRKFFQKRAPFAVPGGGELKLEHVKPAYQVLDAFRSTGVDSHPSVVAIIAESKQLQEWQDLFELYVQDYLPLTRCAEDLLHLKNTWDTIAAVLYTFADWYKTPWDKIDVDFLVEETKKLTKEVKSLNKAVRNFEVYRLLEDSLKAMLTSLPLVQDLHHPAMRDRHWKMLMAATGKQFVMDARFALGDLLALGLHHYVDACSEIVDRAQKELNIEKQLRRIEDTWRGLALGFSPYQDTDINALHVDDAITEALENDNLQLQGLASQKYVQLNPMFGDSVAAWQRKLGTVDAVLTTWVDVQKKWQALESIFVGSADIRVQLPEDSKRFAAVNADYQDLMRSAADITNVVEAANLDGRQERLEGMLVQLESCEKALQDYLETKRIAFPRFYFVAPADLLDILSKGSNPQLILRHLPKNFDNVHNLSFRLDERGEPTKAATGMYSGEDLLSKSKHYDWKLRAIKTTLYVAGGMKRAAPELTEDKVLLRALRDFNLGKLTSDDTSIFVGLLNDLFPKTLELVPRAREVAFETRVRDAAIELGYQPDETFCLKIGQLRELFVVRWSVFLLGPAGCGKSAIWRTLMKAQNNAGEKTVYRPINPKAVTRNELYGYLHPQTREWKEGLVSVTFRDFSNNTTNAHQWIVLDGDIDAEWIESMNTVMDDNKMLTLASNERIPLTPSMRLLLEINHMNHCSPATVSRGGVIFVNVDDVGWKPVVDSWIERLEASEYRPLLTTLFSRYVDPCLEYCRRNFKTVVPLPAVNQVMTICKILEGILPKESVRGAPPPDKKLLEHHFVFACIWAFGGCMLVDKVTDHRAAFSKWWVSEWKGVQFPEKGSVYDYYVDPETCLMVPWDEKVPRFSYAAAAGNGSKGVQLFVPTVETTRLTYFLDSLLANRHYVMFVGNTGTGKTAMLMNKLRSLDPEAVASCVINMNSFSDAPSLQLQMEQPLEKKSGARFGPPGSRRLIYLIDDLNMPYVDKYDTQSAIELARQMVDYRGWYDKQKILLKEIQNCQYAAAMNPTAGSFNITPRMQRHFVTFAVQMPNADIVRSIYSAIMEGHIAGAGLDESVARLGSRLVDATIELHRMVMHNFLPSAVKFHYQFNLREMSNVVGGLCRMTKDEFKEPITAVRLWVHEAERVFRDRMVSDADAAKFDEFRAAVIKKFFEDVPGGLGAVEERPLLYTSFMQTAEDQAIYTPVPSYEALRKVLDDKLAEYNETNTVMDLVLFQQAMEHVTRIARIMDQPRGNAMLVGVGGSGKQSLARLAAFICGYDVYQIAVSSTYGVADFKEALLGLYAKTGGKGIPTMFLMTDNQIVKEQFLVYINDLLSTGLVSDLFTPEDKEGFCNAVRNEVKAQGILDTPEACWDFFIAKARRLLHVVLCFSPVGEKFRVRARQFPALVNCTQFDWFHGWPREALVSVAHRFLAAIPDVADDVRDQLSHHMAHAHTCVSDASASYLKSYRRYSYTTPKSYLELISLYKELLARKRRELRGAIERLQNGVEKIAQASAQVADLQAALKQEQIIVEEKKAATDELIVSIGREKAVVDEAVEAGRGDEEAAAALQSEVQNFQLECSQDLAVAEPVIAEAEAALNSLDKASLGELKSFGSPAAEVVQVVSACMCLTAAGGKIPKDLSWAAGKKYMGNVDAFLKSLLSFDKDNIPVICVDVVERDYISNPGFRPDNIKSKSSAAAGLCAWVLNICKYFRIYQVVAPKRAALAEANRKLENANKKLAGIRAKVKELQDRVAALEAGLMKATEDKNAAIAQAERTSRKAGLADRLVNGLSGENKRWSETIRRLESQEGMLVGDVLLASAFVSYAGPFNMALRQQLVTERWLPDILERGIPTRSGIKPLDMLTDDSTKAKWAQEGLPTDPLSVENGAIMTNAARWSLMIDPQLQGIKWIMSREASNGLVILQQSQPKYVDKVLACIEQGLPLLLENLPVELDAVLDPVLGKRTVKRGRALIMRIGDAEVEYDQGFRLYLQTKLANPHYKPEIAAQCTLVNFCVTEKGLEDQLLALVVNHERPDLQEQAGALVSQLGQYTITLKELEDSLLARLANAQGDILEDIELIENLEETKRTALDIEDKVRQARLTEASISKAREVYRPVAARGSLVYFLIDGLDALDRVYHYSMANFVYVLVKGMDLTPGGPDESKVPKDQRLGQAVELEQRVQLLVDTTCQTVFNYVAQGLFERHKLIVSTQLCMAVLRARGELQRAKFDVLLRGPRVMGVDNPLADWVPESVWGAVQALKELEDYSSLPDDLVGSSKRWREWMELERPEDEPLPGDWKRMPEFERLLLFRALRPDRLTAAMRKFVTNVIGAKYVASQPYDLERSFQDSSPGTPILALLSPGVDVAGSVEALGARLGFTAEGGRYYSVALGQGQEPIAMNALAAAHKAGGWVLLQNIHLTIDWTSGPLEKRVDKLADGAHPDFRLFLSAEPPPALERPLPISLLQASIKLTNEPPEGLRANLKRAYSNFTEEMLEGCAKQAEFRTIIFALCYFHAALLERKKFGVGNLPGATSGIGWNMNYPFNTGDLLCCGQTAVNYLENNARVPWDDLRYMFGEIMYGGHIVEDWDRRLATGYLQKYFTESLLEGAEMFPGFLVAPNSMNQKQVLDYIEDVMPPETPLAFGLHPNAEIGFKLREAEAFCGALVGLQPSEGGGEGGLGVEEKAKMVLDDLGDRLPDGFDLEDIRGRVDEVTPYAMVAIQECERMNLLLAEMKRSLAELDLGLKGDLTVSEPMERLMKALAADTVPASWRNLAYPSLRPLGSWLSNLLARVAQLSEWTADLGVPKVVWLSGLFNPQSFLTAVMQTTARRNDWPLDKTVLLTEVTKKTAEQVDAPSRDGAFVHGLTLEGARWDDKAGCLEDSKPKELFCPMPVLLVRAVTADKAETRDVYQCPVYATEARFREEVFTAQLKSKAGWIKWTLAGVAMFLDIA